MKNIKYYLQKAKKEKWALGQFNFSDVSQLKGIVAAAQNFKSPVIIGTSEGESKFVGLEEAVALKKVLVKKTGVPIFLNLDHGKSFEHIQAAILAGYDMVHFDGSKLSLDENIKITKKIIVLARKKGVVVEGEVGRFGTAASKVYQEKFEIKEEDLTNPIEAEKYAEKTKVDLLAVSVGTFHGVDATGISPSIKLQLLKDITGKIKLPMVLHGGSGTPQKDIKEAISLGITKININTDVRLAFSERLRKILEIDKEEITPYKYLADPIDAVKKAVEEKLGLFGSQGKA